MPIIHTLKSMGLEILEEAERQSARETACRVVAGAVAKIVLKKILGKKFKIIGAVTQLGIMSCDTGRWDDNEIKKKPIFLSR